MTYKPDVIELPLSYYVDKLRNNEPFVFARYGDGEWLTILGEYHLRNSNGCSFTPELSKALSNAIVEHSNIYNVYNKSPDINSSTRENSITDRINNYQYSLLHITRRLQGSKIKEYLASNDIAIPWYNGDIMLNESLQGNLFPLIEQIREKKVLYVGNVRLKDLSKAGFFDYSWFVEPPPKNAFEHRQTILNLVLGIIEKEDVDFIGWSSGLAAKYFINEVYKQFSKVTQIDFGSLFDGYFKPVSHIQELGKRGRGAVRAGSRSYIRRNIYDWAELLEMNTNG